MNPAIDSVIQTCEWGASSFLIFSDNVFVPLIYYSHLGSIIPVLLIALLIFFNRKKQLAPVFLLCMSICFSAWVFSDLVLWATEYPPLTMFFWTLLNLFEPLVYFFAFYFFYVFVFNKDFSTVQKILFALPLLPTFLLAPTSAMLLGFDLSNCDRAASEGILATYGYVIELLYAALIVGYGVYAWLKTRESSMRRQTMFLAIGTFAFLISFSLGNIVEVFSENWFIGQYGLFGAPVLTAFLAYLIVTYRAFNLRLIGAQVLVAALWLLVLALLFIRTIEIVRVVVSITLIFVLVLGILLVRGVYREIAQREHIEKLAQDLEKANAQQVTLIHFITHQIKGFVTKSRNIFSMALEGDFGPIPEQLKPMLEEGFKSDTKGVDTIQGILTAANIKSGKVTFTMMPCDVKALVDEIARDLKPNADRKGVALNLNTGTEPLSVNGDCKQLVNAFKNLIDNSIKYTPQGSVNVALHKEGNIVRFTIEDTGVGITPEDMKNLFTEGGHGKESVKVNVESTGFGLYIVKNIIEAHKGKVWAESDGAGKGSRFIVELPA
jgi:signal transduction histidine kinase